MKRFTPLLFVLALVLIFSTSALAQLNPTGTLTGTVTDAQGAAIVGANITITDPTTGAVFNAKTEADGHFQVANLPPANYTLTVEVAGFKKIQMSNVTILVSKTNDVPIKMEVGEVNTIVNVEGGGQQIVETTNTSVSSTISGKAITTLPFNSRSAVLLGVLDPGAQTVGGSRNTTFEGLPKGTINITFDGINIQDNLLKSSDGFFALNDPRIDDVDEFNITAAGNSVDKAGEGAVQIGYVSKSGSNQFHGGVWEYFRNTYLDANYYFTNLASQPRQIVKLNEYGYKIGGPILKNKLFFFSDLDNFNFPQSLTRTRTILTPGANGSANGFYIYTPSSGTACVNGTNAGWETTLGNGNCQVNLFAMAAANGFGSANSNGTGICNLCDPVVNKYLTLVEGTPAVAGVTVTPNTAPYLENVNFNNSASNVRRYPDFRLDYDVTSHHHLEFDYHYAWYDSSPDILNSVDATFPAFSQNVGAQLSNRNLWVGAWRWTLGTSASNELRVGIQIAPVNFGLGVNGVPGLYPTIQTNLGTIPYRFGIFGINGGGVSGFLLSPGNTQGRNSALGQLTDNFTLVKGTHNMAFGYSMTNIYYNDFFATSASVTLGLNATSDPAAAMFSTTNLPGAGSTDSSNMQSLWASLMGRIGNTSNTTNSYTNSVAFSPSTGNFQTGARQLDKVGQHEIGVYATDTWRIRPSFSLTYGLRWEYDGAPFDKLNEYSMVPGGTAGAYGISGLGNLFAPGTLSGTVPSFVNDKGRSWFNPYYKAFAPQVGLAWQPNVDNSIYKKLFGGAGRTIVRADYSVAYSREGLQAFFGIAPANPGFTGSQTLLEGTSTGPGTFQAGTLTLSSPGGLSTVVQTPQNFVTSIPLSPLAGQSTNSINPNLKPPMVQSWTLGIERQIGNDSALEVRYVGNHGVGLWDQYNLNEINIFGNNFLSDFQSAQANLAICQNNAASCTAAQGAAGVAVGNQTANSFADWGIPDTSGKGLGTQRSMPFITALVANSNSAGPGAASQLNSGFRNSNTISQFISQGLAGAYANSLNSLGNWENLTGCHGIAGCSVVGNGLGYPSNIFMVNPDARGGSFLLDNAAASNYNALVVDFRRRPSKGISYDVSYSFSKSLTNYNANSSSDFNGFTTLRNTGYDKGPAPFDTRHAIKGNVLWDLPFGEGRKFSASNGFANRIIGGWSINGVVRWQTGPPIQIAMGNYASSAGGSFNQNGAGITLVGLTANQLQGMLHTNKVQNPGSAAVWYFPNSLLASNLITANTNVLAPCFTAGQLCSKVFVWGPQFFRADLSLVKTTKITERVSLELRAEALNAFNDQNFYYGCGVGTSPCTVTTNQTAHSFGQMGSSATNGAYSDINTTQDPGGRILQIVGRINF